MEHAAECLAVVYTHFSAARQARVVFTWSLACCSRFILPKQVASCCWMFHSSRKRQLRPPPSTEEPSTRCGRLARARGGRHQGRGVDGGDIRPLGSSSSPLEAVERGERGIEGKVTWVLAKDAFVFHGFVDEVLRRASGGVDIRIRKGAYQEEQHWPL